MKPALLGDVAARLFAVLDEVDQLAAGENVRILADLVAACRSTSRDEETAVSVVQAKPSAILSRTSFTLAASAAFSSAVGWGAAADMADMAPPSIPALAPMRFFASSSSFFLVFSFQLLEKMLSSNWKTATPAARGTTSYPRMKVVTNFFKAADALLLEPSALFDATIPGQAKVTAVASLYPCPPSVRA